MSRYLLFLYTNFFITYSHHLQLLERDPSKRLSDPALVKAHPYFAPIDWDKLSKKDIPPPYIPPVAGDMETTAMIDDGFLSQPIVTPTQGDSLAGMPATNVDGFTYVNDSELTSK